MEELKYFDEFSEDNCYLKKNSLRTYKFILDKMAEHNMNEIDFVDQSEDEIIDFIMNNLGIKSYTSDIITKRVSTLFRYYSWLYDHHYIADEQFNKIADINNNKKKFSQLLIEKQKQFPAFPLPSKMFALFRRIDNDDELLNNNYYHTVIELMFNGLNDEGLMAYYNLKYSDIHMDGTIDVKTVDERYNLKIGKDLCNRLIELHMTRCWETWQNEIKHENKRVYSMHRKDKDYVFKFTTNTVTETPEKMKRIIFNRLSYIEDKYNLRQNGLEFKPTRIFYSGLYYRVTKEILEQGLDISAIAERKFASDESKKCRDILQAEMDRVHLHKSVSITRTNFIPVMNIFAEDVMKMEKNK